MVVGRCPVLCVVSLRACLLADCWLEATLHFWPRGPLCGSVKASRGRESREEDSAGQRKARMSRDAVRGVMSHQLCRS